MSSLTPRHVQFAAATETQNQLIAQMTPALMSALDLILPPPIWSTGKSGEELVTPTLPLPRKCFVLASEIRKLRLSYVCSRPLASAKAAVSAIHLFGWFLSNVAGCTWTEVDPEVCADFLTWRCRGTSAIVTAQPPREPYVSVTSALSTLALVRSTAPLVGLCSAPSLYGEPIKGVVKRLSTARCPDSVRKTPVPASNIWALVQEALEGSADLAEAAALAVGLAFFMRVGELTSLHLKDLCVVSAGDRPAVAVTFRFFKAAGGKNKEVLTEPVCRYCTIPLLVECVSKYLHSIATFPTSSLAFPHIEVQPLLRKVLGAPPLLTGESKPLPWSLRAGAATWVFSSGLPLSFIQRMGRWRSEVGALYCVLTPVIQASLWSKVTEPTQDAWMEAI